MIYLDTNVIIYAIENHPVYGKKCKDVLKDIEEGKLKPLLIISCPDRACQRSRQDK